MNILPNITVITGPTATGKSDLSVLLAKKLNGEIISADSMQVYKLMDIGTAKPTTEEMCGIPHHMIDFVSPFDSYSVARYVEDASKCIDDILHRGKHPILTGGTGLYIDSLIKGRTFLAKGDKELRKELEDEFDSLGGEVMLKKLSAYDNDSAVKLHSNDKKRIIRALESYLTTGKTISQHDIDSKTILPKYDALKFALNFAQRENLYSKIDNRVDNMILKGLENEVKALLKMGVSGKNTSMQAIGYKEISFAILNNSNINTAIEKIKMESRRYAKRQLTWLRRDNEIKWILWDKVPDFNYGINAIYDLIRSTG